MSAITKERVANLLQFNSEGSDCQSNAEQWEVHELARIALASLEAGAVAFVMADDLKDSSIISTPAYRDLGEAMERTVGDVVALYAAPPAPVSEREPEQMFGIGSVFKPQTLSVEEVDCDNCAHYQPNVCHGEGCPAAMLQGADGNYPVISDGWVACSERMPDNRGKSHELYLCWGTYFDGAEPDYIPALFFIHPTNGWCEWEPLEDDCDPKKVVITHWMPLPAAPQQEAQ
ncbi:DUF551 domain-containing protein [Citrobacter portucalensis]|uniref:DUF551 domain-containing protein n=1 Tax=Citrobacter portucalensis TaxID=1639133 RepID=UPI00351CC0F0